MRILVNDTRPEWEGTTAALLEELTSLVSEKQARTKDWPQTARALTSHLQRAKSSLRKVGIAIRRSSKRTNRGHLLTIARSSPPKAEKQPSPSSRPSSAKVTNDLHHDGRRDRTVTVGRSTVTSTNRQPSRSNPMRYKENDGRDGRDGRTGTSAVRQERKPYVYAPDIAKRAARAKQAFEQLHQEKRRNN